MDLRVELLKKTPSEGIRGALTVRLIFSYSLKSMAPEVGLEPLTYNLTKYYSKVIIKTSLLKLSNIKMSPTPSPNAKNQPF